MKCIVFPSGIEGSHHAGRERSLFHPLEHGRYTSARASATGRRRLSIGPRGVGIAFSRH